MNDNGYVYVLMNPSMKGLVKIGKSTRSSQQRADELSSTTGVPTPFSVVYDYYFENCTKAEQYIHTYLEEKGFRVSEKREFFEIPVKDAVDAVLEASNHFGKFIPKFVENFDDDFDEEGIFSEKSEDEFREAFGILHSQRTREPWESIFQQAETHYYGLYDELVDYTEAMHYYLQAIKLGSIKSYRCVAMMYMDGEGVSENNNKALKYLKEGATKGDFQCYVEMAVIFGLQDEIENALKCWKKFFTTKSDNIDIEDATYYITFIFTHDGLKLKYIDKLLVIKDEIIEHYLNCIEECYGTENEGIIWNYERIISYVNSNFIDATKRVEANEDLIDATNHVGTNENHVDVTEVDNQSEVTVLKSIWKKLFN